MGNILRRKSLILVMDYEEYIEINPTIRFGKPCIRGHRIWVSLILDFLVSGRKESKSCSFIAYHEDPV